MKRIKVGSRASALAVAQAEWVIGRIKRAHPEYGVELVTMTTEGDRYAVSVIGYSQFVSAEFIQPKDWPDPKDLTSYRSRPLPSGKGLFTKELENALLDGRIDIAVHSLKDVPYGLDARLPVLAYSPREDCRDAIVFPKEGPQRTAIAGSSSARRRVQLLRLFPGVQVRPVRGNVQTRLKKLDGGEYDFLVLAAAGLNRLGLSGRISRPLSPDEMLPAPGQGVIAVQGRSGEDYHYLGACHDPEAAICAQAERAFADALGGGCTLPVAAYARKHGAEMRLDGLFADEEKGIYIRETAVFAESDALEAAEKLAKKIQKKIQP